MNTKHTVMLIATLCVALIGLYWAESLLATAGHTGYGLYFRIAYGVVTLLFVGACGWVIRLGYLRWKEAQQELQESELLFMEETEREIAGGGLGAAGGMGGTDGMDGKHGTDGPDRTDTADGMIGSQNSHNSQDSQASHDCQTSQGLPGSQDRPPSAPAPAAGAVPGMPAFSPALQKRIGDLVRLGVLTSYEGKVDLPPPALPAPIYRLRSGGLVLFLDQLENQRFLSFQARRFRAIVAEGADGEPIVVRRFQDFLADQLDGPK